MLPLFRRKIVVPLWTIKSKSPKFPYLKDLAKTEYSSMEVLKNEQWFKFSEILQYCHVNNEFYQNFYKNVSIHDIKSLSDIKKLPILTKSLIKANYNKIISTPFQKLKLFESKTGGSTGTSLRLFKTEECTELKNAIALRSNSWTGWQYGEPVAAVWGNPVYPVTFKEKLKNFLFTPFFYLDTMNINDEAVIAFSEEWKRIKPSQLYGHAHSIFVLAEILDRLKIQLSPPKGIITTSMMLLQNERTFIEKIIKAKVFDRYGCEEVSLIASECEKHEGYHLNIEHLIVEFIKEDGTDAAPGEPGDIIVTDLLNKAMPMIRYKVEDVGVPSARKCSCGRSFPLMEKVIGRTADFIQREDGSQVAGISLIERTLTKIQGIYQLQIIQDSLQDISLNIVREIDSFSDDTEKLLIDEIKKSIGNSVNINCKYVERIKQEESGKYRFCISKIKNQ